MLRKVDCKINLLGRLSYCLTDGRSPLQVTHPFSEMLAQRIYGLALGYGNWSDFRSGIRTWGGQRRWK